MQLWQNMTKPSCYHVLCGQLLGSAMTLWQKSKVKWNHHLRRLSLPDTSTSAKMAPWRPTPGGSMERKNGGFLESWAIQNCSLTPPSSQVLPGLWKMIANFFPSSKHPWSGLARASACLWYPKGSKKRQNLLYNNISGPKVDGDSTCLMRCSENSSSFPSGASFLKASATSTACH